MTRFFAVVLLLLGTSGAFAANPYSDCGIGAALFKNDIAATISNVIWDLGTTAVISGTASPDTCSGADMAAAEMIFDTYVSIEEETARGGGEHVYAVLEIMQCQQSAQSAIVAALRDDFAASLQDVDYAARSDLQKAESYYNMVKAQVTGPFAGACAS